MDQIRSFEKLSPERKAYSYLSRIQSDKNLRDSCRIVQEKTKSLKVFKKFGGYAGSIEVVDKKYKDSPDSEYVLLKIDTSKMRVSTRSFSVEQTVDATSNYTRAEKKSAQKKTWLLLSFRVLV